MRNKIKQYVELSQVTETYADLFWMNEGLLNFKKELCEIYQRILDLPRIEMEDDDD